MTQTQEQIDELVKAATVIADSGFPVSEARFSDYSALTNALAPFTKPQRIPVLPAWEDAPAKVTSFFSNIVNRACPPMSSESFWKELRSLTAKEQEK